MSGPIKTAFEAFRTNLLEDPTAISLGLNEEKVRFGAETLSEHSSPPRIVFVPMEGPIEKGTHNGYVPRHLETWRLRWDVYCWGSDADDAFSLCQSALRAIRIAAGGSYVAGSMALMAKNAEVTAAGRAMRLTFTLLIPIVDAPLTTATIETATVTPSFDS